MSNPPPAPSRGNQIRWVITGCLLALAVPCVVWIAVQVFGGGPSIMKGGSPIEKPAHPDPAYAALDVLALIGLGVWVLRPPLPGAIGFFGRWLGKVLLFLGLGAAIVIFLFATCLVVPALGPTSPQESPPSPTT